MKRIGLIVGMLTMIQALTVAQETADTSINESPFDFSADIVSRYVWRGMLFGGTPHVQLTASYSKGGFSAGVWGSYGVAMPFYEIDLFASYSLSAFTFTIFDYFIED